MLDHQAVYKKTRCKQWLMLMLMAGTGLAQASDRIGLPFTTVAHGMSRTQLGIEYVETAADPVIEPEMVEIAPDRYSRSYRNGHDVYKMMTEESFDDEPMVVVVPEIDPSRAIDVVVIAAYTPPVYIDITPSEQIVDPIARGEDEIYLQISMPPEPPVELNPVIQPKQRRFFSTPLD